MAVHLRDRFKLPAFSAQLNSRTIPTHLVTYLLDFLQTKQLVLALVIGQSNFFGF